MRQMLQFFAVSSVSAWRQLVKTPAMRFRGGERRKENPALSQHGGELELFRRGTLKLSPLMPRNSRKALQAIRRLTSEPATVWQREVVRLCAAAGVAVVFTREIPGASVSGATRMAYQRQGINSVEILSIRQTISFGLRSFMKRGISCFTVKSRSLSTMGTAKKIRKSVRPINFARYAHPSGLCRPIAKTCS